MATHTSATVREHTPHANRTTRTNTIMNALKERALAVLNDQSIDIQDRAIIRYALETNDPWLARLVRQAEAGEDIVENMQAFDVDEENVSDAKIITLTEMICCAGDEPATKSAALLVLMTTLESATDPKAMTSLAKQFAFTRCAELNFCGMNESQIALIQQELLGE